jgi:hypothetical protein
MLDFWTIPTANMAYIESQNYFNMVVGKYEIQIFEVVMVVLVLLLMQLSFDVFVPTIAHALLSFYQVVCPHIYVNVISTSSINFID